MFHLYGLLIGFGLLAGIWIAEKQSKRFLVKPKLIEDALVWIAIPAVIGARIYHVSTDWHLYTQASFIQILAIWNGGLGYFGALMGGVVGLILYVLLQKKKRTNQNSQLINFFTILDLLSFGAPLAQAIGRFGNYFNQELYGLPTTLPWGLMINGQRYHPLFAYEAIGTLSIFAFLNWLGWGKKFPIGKGQYACVYITLYATLRFWLEFLRIETAHVYGVFEIFSIAQWVCLALAIGSLCIFWLRRHADRGIEWEVKTIL